MSYQPKQLEIEIELWYALSFSAPTTFTTSRPSSRLSSRFLRIQCSCSLFRLSCGRAKKQSFKVAASFQTLKLSRMLCAQITAKGGYHFLPCRLTPNRSTSLSYKRMARCRFNLHRVLFTHKIAIEPNNVGRHFRKRAEEAFI